MSPCIPREFQRDASASKRLTRRPAPRHRQKSRARGPHSKEVATTSKAQLNAPRSGRVRAPNSGLDQRMSEGRGGAMAPEAASRLRPARRRATTTGTDQHEPPASRPGCSCARSAVGQTSRATTDSHVPTPRHGEDAETAVAARTPRSSDGPTHALDPHNTAVAVGLRDGQRPVLTYKELKAPRG